MVHIKADAVLHRACAGRGDAKHPGADAHDACPTWAEWLTMNLPAYQTTPQLMLMMLAGLGQSGKHPAADVHDACPTWAEWLTIGLSRRMLLLTELGQGGGMEGTPQLMLMMLPGLGHATHTAADAHDAGRGWSERQSTLQLMLMMLAWLGAEWLTIGLSRPMLFCLELVQEGVMQSAPDHPRRACKAPRS